MSSRGSHVPTSEVLGVPQGSFSLTRVPAHHNLRAWDAADEYLLTYLADREGVETEESVSRPTLLINDAFGALACALAPCQPIKWGDSVLSERATMTNLVRNGLAVGLVEQLPGSAAPAVPADIGGGSPDRLRVLIKIPKTLSLLEYQLRALRPLLSSQSTIVGAAMSRHIHSSTLSLFEEILGPTTTSLAKKKARLVFTDFDPDLDPGPRPPAASYEFGSGLSAITLPGVFANRRLDIGTRFLLDHLPVPKNGDRVLDLGCGNGIVGVTLGVSNPASTVLFSDISYLAIASARATHNRALPKGRQDEFLVTDGAEGVDDSSIDLVVCNPPFHDQHVVGYAAAQHLFAEGRRVLRSGGQLVVVGNRHLGHHVRINELFGNVKTVVSNSKFVILSATRS